MHKASIKRTIAMVSCIMATTVLILVSEIEPGYVGSNIIIAFLVFYLPLIATSITLSVIGIYQKEIKCLAPLILSILSLLYVIPPWNEYFYTEHTDLWLFFQNKQQTHLYLDDTEITDKGMKIIGKFKHLDTLILYNDTPNHNVTDNGFKYIGSLEKLTTLRFSNISISDRGLRYLRGLNQLEVLAILDTRISDSGLASLYSLKKLEELELEGQYISGTGLEKFTQLSHLALRGPTIDNKSLLYVCQLNGLRFLGLYGTRINDEGVAYIAKMKGLKYLDIQKSLISDRALKELREALPNLFD